MGESVDAGFCAACYPVPEKLDNVLEVKCTLKNFAANSWGWSSGLQA